VVKTLIWYTPKDAQVCADCAPLDGKEIDIADNDFVSDAAS
jgi:hypothetical protein